MKNMKKTVVLILLILIIFNFIFLNQSYAGAEDYQNNPLTKPSDGTSDTIVDDTIDGGVAAQTNGSSVKTSLSFDSFGTSSVGFIIGLITRLLNVALVIPLDLLAGQLTYSTENNKLSYFITIDKLVFNRVPILNINYFNTADEYHVGNLSVQSNASNKIIKENIANVYYICRILALIIGLLVLVYIGIRMAISTVASEQAKYKKMLMSWIESVLIIFLMPYIISAIIALGEVLTGVFFNLRNDILDVQQNASVEVFEEVVRSSTFEQTINSSGLELAMWSIIYWVLLYQEIKFLWVYTKRFFMCGFLIAIAPLVTITYSMDKAADGKAQAFSNWLKEFLLNVLIQPLHALVYLVIVLTANNIAERSPLISIALLVSIGSVEKMVRVIFNITDTLTIRSLKDSLIKKKG